MLHVALGVLHKRVRVCVCVELGLELFWEHPHITLMRMTRLNVSTDPVETT